MQITVNSNGEKRLRNFHPWVMKEDIQDISNGLRSGQCTDFKNKKGEFLGFGYYNTKSKITGRIITFDSTQKFLVREDELAKRVAQAWLLRKERGFNYSCRICFGEADNIPGLIIDYYLIKSEPSDHHVFVFQLSTLGIENLILDPIRFLKKMISQYNLATSFQINENEITLVLRNDLSSRKYEGLEVEVPRVLQTQQKINLEAAEIRVSAAGTTGLINMKTDLYRGQKTGFFLDQFGNIQTLCQILRGHNTFLKKKIRVLDLCSYVGQWSTQLSSFLKTTQSECEFHLVDVSSTALDFAKQNVEQYGYPTYTHKLDVLSELDSLKGTEFDLIIADPPAFIKSKKDLPTGSAAYAKLNSLALDLIKPGGILVSCSCSGHFAENDLRIALAKALGKSKKFLNSQIIGKGRPSGDHPYSAFFPEGSYLKMLIQEALI